MLPLELVSIENEVPKTTSLVVAKFFGKHHYNVLKAIKKLGCSSEFAKLNFNVCFNNSDLQNGKPQPYYEMTKDGFMFLVMGFTGKQAARLKEAYINEFNRMSDALNQRQNSLMFQYNKITIAYDTATKNASDAGRALSILGKQIKPDLQERLEQLEQQMQLVLNFEHKKADNLHQDASAYTLIKGNNYE